MPEFKIRNLMVDVVSGVQVPDLDKLCLFPTNVCWFERSCLLYISRTCIGISDLCHLIRTDPCRIMHTRPLQCQGESVPCAGSNLPMGCDGSDVVIIDLRQLVVNPDVIQEVQAELNQVLQAVHDRGIELNRTMAPQTLAQAELLENELKAALEEVQKMKGGLK
jgi:hypothetical protein